MRHGGLSHGFRSRRFEFFAQVAGLRSGMTILDVGGTPWSAFFRDRIDLSVTFLNIRPAEYYEPRLLPGHRYIQADARHIPKADRLRVAGEMMRVGRFLFAEVPYRYFPLEPHYLFPFAQFAPDSVRRLIARHWPLAHTRKAEYERIDPPDRREVRRLFPTLTMTSERLGPLTKALYVWGPTPPLTNEGWPAGEQ